MVVENKVLSATEYLERMTGYSYYPDYDEDELEFIERIMAERNDNLIQFNLSPMEYECKPFNEVEQLDHTKKWVLVGAVDMNSNQYPTVLMWYTIPENANYNYSEVKRG